MLNGKKFKLGRETIALDILNGRRTVISLPVGSVVKVVSGPLNTDRMVDVAWNGKTLVMFVADLDMPADEISEPNRRDQSASAQG